MNRNSIKESFDNLPAAVCFFDERGIVRLANRRMLAVSAALLGSGVQTLEELRAALAAPPAGIEPLDAAWRIYRFPDGTALRFSEERITDADGARYTQVAAADVTELIARQTALREENRRLDDANERARRLYRRMPEIVREEETLAMKMRVHDDIGHGILSARRALLHADDLADIRAVSALWERSLSLLCRTNGSDAAPADAFAYAVERARSLGVTVLTEGELPEAAAARELFAFAVRECCTNCVRHAGGTAVYVRAAAENGGWRLEIRNNGAPPAGPIREGGGLGALRRRIEKSGGTMEVLAAPEFVLTLFYPKEETPCPA